MAEVYIVKKSFPAVVTIDECSLKIDISTNEAVFAKIEDAEDYIKRRKDSKDRDDRGAIFAMEPWRVE